MRNFTKFVLATALLLSAAGLSAQRNCGMDEMVEHQLHQNPQLMKARDEINAHAQSYTDAVTANPNARINALVTIPVVVHVVYNNATENISDAQIQSQINVLNADFRKLNSDASLVPSAFSSLAADPEIQFCLAQRTPTGAATTGIVRVSSTVTAFGLTDNMKFSSSGGSDVWNSSKYLNIWVCDIGGSTLGFAYLPGTAPTGADGVVIDYRYFGTTSNVAAPFNKGRTATHEVGHYLNLNHIWGGNSASCTDSDNVSDTPNQADENYGCPSFPQVSCSNGPNGDMFMNYMDYVNDACMFMFSTGQKNRMQALFAAGGFRAGLATSDGCIPPSAGTCGTPTANAASSIASTSATANWSAVSGATSYRLEYKTSAATTWTLVTGITTTSYSITGLTASTTYNYRVTAVCASGNSAVSNTVNFTTSAAATCGTPTANAATAVTSSSASGSWSAVTGATSYTVEWKTAAATTWTVSTGFTSTGVNFTGLTANTTYNYRVKAVCASGTSAVSNTVNFTTSAAGCTDSYESNETLAAAKPITLNTNNTAKICTATDIDWYSFSTTTTTGTRVRINLSTLPADYDLELYNSAGSLLLSSAAAGTTSEQIIYNATTTGSYRVKVFGYGGVFNTTTSYTLRCSTKTTNFRLDQDGSAAGISEIGISKVTLFPNPANDKVNVQFIAAQEGQAGIQLLDLTGKVVRTHAATAGEGENTMGIQIGDLAAGLYLVRIELNGTVLTRRLDVVR
jgi:Pregnancy-associated plasma protein-A/Secretion system C-terminal sorting domain/Fibronectin type III domain/Bacterial pre-peptidase C-terminal domain